MKIGIMSYWDTTHNYGQVVQCFAMQEFIKELGHEPFHIKYILGAKSLKRKLTDFAKIVVSGHLNDWKKLKQKERTDETTAVSLQLNQAQQAEAQHISRNFDKFKDTYLNFSEQSYTYDELRKSPPQVDALIAGSDQIWCYPDPGYFLKFGQKKTLRIAYAPSFGGIWPDNKLIAQQYRNLLSGLDVITSREQCGVNICRSLGYTNAIKVPDPSFLIESDKYRKIALAPRHVGKNILFLYLLGNPIDIDIKEIFDWANERNLEVKYVTAQGRLDEFPKEYPNVDEWLGLIDSSKYIVTNSFHGMAMSIIFNKQFLVIPVTGSFSRMNGRITDTLSHLNLSDRIYSNSLDKVSDKIHYAPVNDIIKNDKITISNYFRTWLSHGADDNIRQNLQKVD